MSTLTVKMTDVAAMAVPNRNRRMAFRVVQSAIKDETTEVQENVKTVPGLAGVSQCANLGLVVFCGSQQRVVRRRLPGSMTLCKVLC